MINKKDHFEYYDRKSQLKVSNKRALELDKMPIGEIHKTYVVRFVKYYKEKEY